MKKFLLGIVGVLLLVLAGLGVFLAGFDLNEYKGEVVKAAREATGRDFEITGDIGFKASLIPTISVEGVRLGNAEWAQHANMLEVDRFEARVQLLPLLSGTIKIHHVLVDGATLILEQDKSGRGNWAFDTVDETPEPGAETSGTAPAFDVRSIVVRDSRIEYRATDEQAVVVIVPDMTLSPQGFGKPLSLKAALTYNEMPIAAAAELAPIGRLLDNEPYNLDVELEVAEVEIDMSGVVAAPLDGTGIALEFTLSLNDTDVLPADMQKTLAPHLPLHLSGKATGGGEAYAIENLQMTAGESDLSGAITIDLGDDVPGVNIVANSKQLMLPTAETEATKETAPDRVFSTDPLPLDGLAAANVKLRANFGKIQMGSTTISAVELSVELDDRVLEIEMPKAQIGGGTVNLSTTLEADGSEPNLELTLKIEKVNVPALMSDAASSNIEGGVLNATIELEGKGASLAQIAGGADGLLQADLTGINLRKSTLATGDLGLSAYHALNPLAGKTDGETIECAVVNFPVNDGTARSETGLGIRTSRLNILGGGSIELGTEQIDLGVNPKPREGIGLNVAGIADFVRLGGTLMNPQPTTDAAGIAKAGLKAGAAIATMGLSVVAEGAFDRSQGDIDVCGVAAGRVKLEDTKSESGATATVKSAAESTTQAVKNAGSAIGKTLKGLFGD